MRYALLILTTLVPLAAAVPAQAGPCGARPCTSEQINRALQWLGRPEHEQIGHARVLHDDGTPAAGTTKQDVRIQSNAPIGYSFR